MPPGAGQPAGPSEERYAGSLVYAAVGALALVGLGIRLVGLDTESMWLDEAGRAAIAALPLGQIPHAVQVVELSPPLYHILLHAWIGLAGDGDLAVRLFSALLVLPTVPLAWSLGRALSGCAVGLLLAAWAAANPFAVHFGQEAAMYALVLPLSLFGMRAAVG